MSIITVYRVEDDRAKGPYIHQSYRNDDQALASNGLAWRHSDYRGGHVDTEPHLHPGPDDDLGLRVRWQFMNWSERYSSRHYNFGFESTARLGEWFFGERDTLELLNMHVAVYEVPHQAVVRGEWQLAFRRPSARLLRTLDLAGLVE